MTLLSRRSFLFRASALVIAAPAIVQIANLMPVRRIILPDEVPLPGRFQLASQHAGDTVLFGGRNGIEAAMKAAGVPRAAILPPRPGDKGMYRLDPAWSIRGDGIIVPRGLIA